jgi:hypothetical protein
VFFYGFGGNVRGLRFTIHSAGACGGWKATKATHSAIFAHFGVLIV